MVAEFVGDWLATVTGVWADDPIIGVTVYELIRLPPLSGEVHVTVADPLPAVATTLVGAAGAVGGVNEAGFSNRVVMTQGVWAPVPTVPVAVAPLPTNWS